MTWRPRHMLLALAGLILPIAAQAQSCGHALALGLDVSLSVDDQDFALQRQGLANALLDPAVATAMLQNPNGHVTLAVFEWSGQRDQALLIDWTVIDSLGTLHSVATRLTERPLMTETGRTGIGAAMLYARDLMQRQPDCARYTLDLSGDGHSNSGPAPEDVKPDMQRAGITVNALVIENNFNDPEPSASPPLVPYYETQVITGPGAFTEAIFGFDTYGAAMRRKLLRELQPAISKDRPPFGARPDKRLTSLP